MARLLLNLKEVDRPNVSHIMMTIIKRNFANVDRECGMDEWKLFSLICSPSAKSVRLISQEALSPDVCSVFMPSVTKY